MPPPAPPLLNEDALRTLARAAALQPRCPACRPVSQPGWEALSAVSDVSAWRCVGTLRDGDEEDLEEYHPAGTGYWSPDAPIALGWFPSNRSTVWVCSTCAGAFLRYTEYGGYYQEERVRPLAEALIVRPD